MAEFGFIESDEFEGPVLRIRGADGQEMSVYSDGRVAGEIVTEPGHRFIEGLRVEIDAHRWPVPVR